MRMRDHLLLLTPWFAAGLFAGLWLARPVHLPPALPISPAAVTLSAAERPAFDGDASLMIKFVRPAKVPAFEANLARIERGLRTISDARGRRNAVTYRVFRAKESASNGDVVYVCQVSPVVPGADYTMSKILANSLPSEAEVAFRDYAEALSRDQYSVNLTLVSAFDYEPQ
jgi:hypothetical protein